MLSRWLKQRRTRGTGSHRCSSSTSLACCGKCGQGNPTGLRGRLVHTHTHGFANTRGWREVKSGEAAVQELESFGAQPKWGREFCRFTATTDDFAFAVRCAAISAIRNRRIEYHDGSDWEELAQRGSFVERSWLLSNARPPEPLRDLRGKSPAADFVPVERAGGWGCVVAGEQDMKAERQEILVNTSAPSTQESEERRPRRRDQQGQRWTRCLFQRHAASTEE